MLLIIYKRSYFINNFINLFIYKMMEVCYMFNMREMFRLTGKTVAVTGPTGYLGPIFIEACAQMGADIAAIGRPQSALSQRTTFP